MQDKTWYSILGLDAEPLFLQDHMLKARKITVKITVYFDEIHEIWRNCLLFHQISWITVKWTHVIKTEVALFTTIIISSFVYLLQNWNRYDNCFKLLAEFPTTYDKNGQSLYIKHIHLLILNIWHFCWKWSFILVLVHSKIQTYHFLHLMWMMRFICC